MLSFGKPKVLIIDSLPKKVVGSVFVFHWYSISSIGFCAINCSGIIKIEDTNTISIDNRFVFIIF